MSYTNREAKDQQLRRSTREELSYTMRKGMCSCPFAFSFDSFKTRDQKNIRSFDANSNCYVHLWKKVYLFQLIPVAGVFSD